LDDLREQAALKDWAEAEDVGVNVIVVSVLEEFFKRIKKSKALLAELRLEIRVHPGIFARLTNPCFRPLRSLFDFSHSDGNDDNAESERLYPPDRHS
jgi:hypothetical protein